MFNTRKEGYPHNKPLSILNHLPGTVLVSSLRKEVVESHQGPSEAIVLAMVDLVWTHIETI